MKAFLASLILSMVFASIASAAETPASAEAIKELLEVMNAQAQMKDARQTVAKVIDTSMDSVGKGRTISDKQKKILNEMRVQMLTVMDDLLSWSRFEPMMTKVYQKSFSAQEVAGMVAFYRSDIGKAVIAKMPLVMANTMDQMMGLMDEMRPKFKEIQESTMKKLDATKDQ